MHSNLYIIPGVGGDIRYVPSKNSDQTTFSPSLPRNAPCLQSPSGEWNTAKQMTNVTIIF